MNDVVLVLNAGSSSIKFSTFTVEGRDLALRHRGAIEGIGSDPRFFALDAGGRRVADERVGGGEHEDVLPGLLGWIARQTDRSRVVGVGTDLAGSDAPTIAYVTVYPLTTLLRIVTAQVLALILIR